MITISEIYEAKCNDNSDICQHMPTLKKYAEECDYIVEFGVRSIVSTWAFLAAKPDCLWSVDINHPSFYKKYDNGGCDLELVEKLAAEQGTRFKFFQEDSLKFVCPLTHLIFFDTLHTYNQLSKELELHGGCAEKYMIFHDTESYKDELMPAIKEYLAENKQWVIDKRFYNNNGLLILKHI